MTQEEPQRLAVEEHVFLIGRPPMMEFIGFVTTQAMNSSQFDMKMLADEWRHANDHVRDLETREAGCANNPPIAPLPPALTSLAEQVLADPMFRRSFSLVPSDIGMVDLDRMVVFQKQINVDHVHRIQAHLSHAPKPEEIFRFCLPAEHPQPPVAVARVNFNTYVFTSPSNDLRFIEAVALSADQITGYTPQGPVARAIGLIAGFSSNYLQAIQAEGRLILSNGSHRAYALRDRGITHVPCIIQHTTRRDELEAIASVEVQRNPDSFLTAARPPMLKDYFDDQLRKLVAVPRKLRQVTVQFGTQAVDAPAS